MRAVRLDDGIDRQRAMPAELRPDCSDIGAHAWPRHALLDRFAPTDTGSDLAVGVKAEQLAAAEYRLRLFGRAGDPLLHQHLVGERAAEFLQRPRQCGLVMHEPDAAARGADRGLDD